MKSTPSNSPPDQQTAMRAMQALTELREKLIELNAELEYGALLLRLQAAQRKP